jgi:hypothetical protein
VKQSVVARIDLDLEFDTLEIVDLVIGQAYLECTLVVLLWDHAQIDFGECSSWVEIEHRCGWESYCFDLGNLDFSWCYLELDQYMDLPTCCLEFKQHSCYL